MMAPRVHFIFRAFLRKSLVYNLLGLLHILPGLYLCGSPLRTRKYLLLSQQGSWQYENIARGKYEFS